MAKSTEGSVQTTKSGLKFIDLSAFSSLGGEKFTGLNVLKLAVNQAVGDLTVTKIGVQKVKGRGKDKGKVREIPSYTVKAAGGREYRAPLNASFVMKCADAGVKVGDVIAIARGEGYETKDGNKGIAFDLVVQSRAKK